ncbi:helicase-related protein [Halorhabdus tiamatea]|uniref:helicase-related protein n=1 Tax=Halorhabdus tiamatea TaxID=430914 RepID=UPI0002121495|nr:helicase-related protein [Halorhabdus tiamatea]
MNRAITDQLIERLTGRGEVSKTLYGAQPSNQYFAGSLVSQYEYREAQAEDDTLQNFSDDLSPFTIGVKFRIPADIEDDATVEITPNASGYQRRFPTFSEQLNESNDKENADVLLEEAEPDGDTDSEDIDFEQVDADGYEQLTRVYERIPFELDTYTLTGSDVRTLLDGNNPEKISLDLTDALQQAEGVIHPFREVKDGVGEGTANQVPVQALQNKKSFQNHLNDVYTSTTIDPLWQARLELNARYDSPNDSDEDYITVTARLVNTHGEDFENAIDPEYEDWRSTLFDVGVKAELDGCTLGAFKSKEIEDEYQYEGTIHGVGENCAVEPVYGDTEDPSPQDAIGVRTETVPTYEQAKYLSRNPADIVAPMEVLAGANGRGEVFDALERIASTMEDAAEDYREIKGEMTTGKSSDAEDDFDDAVAAFEYEHKRFEAGIECLRQDERAYESFTLCNEAFDNLGFDRWRMFQIVFIVMSIPDMLKQASGVDDDVGVDFESGEMTDSLDAADIIYFPTGGGKTEAYLGVVTFTAFHDRLRGKEYGMTAFTKFPLRFLSLQQLQRAANVLAQAELLRRKHELGGEEFSIGYLVGKQNTPNKLKEEGQNKLLKAKRDEDVQANLLYVDECPFCQKETVEITGDRERGRIIHQCTNDNCDEHELPIYISDREVYRYSPTFVVSTIDKISIIGMQRRMRTLFGQAKIRCEKHGYAGESECVVQESAILGDGHCSEEDWEEVEPAEPPSLLIQDELHLLREEFGAFDSHYETFLQAYNDRVTDGNWSMKVVAATATIEGAERQVRALYQKSSNIFPEKGPRLRQSFYAYADPIRKQRKMVGAIPRSVSRTYAIEKVHEEYARVIQEYRDDTEKLFQDLQRVDDPYSLNDADIPADSQEREEALQNVLDDYEVQVSYHYSKDNTDLMMRVLRTMINQHLNDDIEPYTELQGELLTGETDLGDVREIMRRLLNHDEEGVDPVHMLIATSMISHGVDIGRLNFIGFFGLPRQTAEYIQSYSRVGREWPGTVFMLHNPVRVRDRSYYTRFQQYQAYQDLLVEATPLERWAEFAIQCTIPGIFCAGLLQYYDFHLEDDPGTSGRIYMFDGFEEAARGGKVSYDELFEFVTDAYGIDEADVVSAGDDDPRSGVELYRKQIKEEFDRLWDACLDKENRIPDSRANDPNTDENNFIPLGVLERDDSVRTPMRNLRDIDEQLTIALDSDTSRLVKEYRE